jgi:hypothetical protein
VIAATLTTTRRCGDGGGATGPLVLALEAAWETMRERHPAIAPAVIVVASGTMGGSPRYGHFAAARWRRAVDGGELAEILVSGEGLERGAVPVLGTLLHEGAHALAHARGVKDTSRQGRWHNAKYRRFAEELGLVLRQVDGIGWSGTVVPAETAAAYAEQLEAIAAAIVVYRRAENESGPGVVAGIEGGGSEGESGTSSKGGGIECPCGRRIRVARAVLEAGPISCGLCGGDFGVAGAEAGADAEAA